MSVDLQVYDLNNNKIDLNEGIDFGIVRTKYSSVVGIKIKNEGKGLAKNVSIESEVFNEKDTVSDEEYLMQQLASSWKTFSLYDDEPFKKSLFLGDINPGAFLAGTRKDLIDFTNADKCMLKDVWASGLTKFTNDTHIFHKGDGISIGIMSKRMMLNDIQNPRDVEVEMNLEFVCTTEGQSSTLPFIAFPVRINSKGDGKGYMFMLQFRRNDSKFKITIYKDAKGMTSYEDRVYGTALFDTITWQDFDKTKKITFKIYNNSSGKPTFEVKYDNVNMKLARSNDSAVNGLVMTDSTSSAYINRGGLYYDMSLYDGDYSVNTSNMLFRTEEAEQVVYVKSTLTEDAKNRTEYISSTTLSYEL